MVVPAKSYEARQQLDDLKSKIGYAINTWPYVVVVIENIKQMIKECPTAGIKHQMVIPFDKSCIAQPNVISLIMGTKLGCYSLLKVATMSSWMLLSATSFLRAPSMGCPISDVS